MALVVQAGRGFWQVFDRSGKVADHVINSCTCPGRITSDALWLTRSGQGFESIVRLGIDPATGQLASRQDTLLSGNFNNFSVTADGSTLVVDDGSFRVQCLGAAASAALQGRFTDSERRFKSTTRLGAQLSPDGARVLMGRNLPSASGRSERRFTVLPFAGGSETPLSTRSDVRGARWVDSVTVSVSSPTSAGIHVGLIDVRTGTPGPSVDIPDSLASGVSRLPDGWAWVPSSADKVIVQRGGKTIEIPRPAWFGELTDVDVDPAGSRLVLVGWNAGTFDSLGVAVVPLEGGAPVYLDRGGGRTRQRPVPGRWLGPLRSLGHARVDRLLPCHRSRQGGAARQGAPLRRRRWRIR